jgi:hypothetical protein
MDACMYKNTYTAVLHALMANQLISGQLLLCQDDNICFETHCSPYNPFHHAVPSVVIQICFLLMSVLLYVLLSNLLYV